MRILILTHEYTPFPGGIARYCLELARSAAECGHEVHVLAPGYNSAGAMADDRKEKFSVRRVKAGRYRTRRLPMMLLETIRCLLQGRWDLIHAGEASYTVVLALFARFIRIPFQCTVHGSDVVSMSSSSSARWLVGGNPFRYARRIVCNSEFTRSLLHEHFPDLDKRRTAVTHLGVAPFWFARPDEAELKATIDRFDLKNGEHVILTVARIDERKGHLLAMDALEAVWSSGVRKFRYIIVGTTEDEEYAARLSKRAAEAAFPVTMAGVVTQEELRALYRLSRVFCMPGIDFPGRVEGFGLAYLEAAAQGLPSVATRINAVPEVIDDGISGLLIEPGKTGCLTEALTVLLRDDAVYSKIHENAAGWARRFSWKECARLTFPDTRKEAAVGLVERDMECHQI